MGWWGVCLYKREIWTQRSWEWPCGNKAETGVLCPQGQDTKDCGPHQELGEEGRTLSWSGWRKHCPAAPGSQTAGLQNWESKSLWFKLSLWSAVTAAQGRSDGRQRQTLVGGEPTPDPGDGVMFAEMNVYAEEETPRLSPVGTNSESPALAVSASADLSASGHRTTGPGYFEGRLRARCFSKQLPHLESHLESIRTCQSLTALGRPVSTPTSSKDTA